MYNKKKKPNLLSSNAVNDYDNKIERNCKPQKERDSKSSLISSNY
eukprot:Gb_33104 [translate_table: standard]